MNRRDFFRLLGIPAIALTGIKVLGLQKSDKESLSDQMARIMNELADKIDKILNENCWDVGY